MLLRDPVLQRRRREVPQRQEGLLRWGPPRPQRQVGLPREVLQLLQGELQPLVQPQEPLQQLRPREGLPQPLLAVLP